MSNVENLLTELVSTLRELLASLILEEKMLLSGELKHASSFQMTQGDLKKKVRALKLKMKKMTCDVTDDEVGQATLLEQQESLEKKIRELSKTNKSLFQSPIFPPLIPESQETSKPKKKVLLEGDSES